MLRHAEGVTAAVLRCFDPVVAELGLSLAVEQDAIGLLAVLHFSGCACGPA